MESSTHKKFDILSNFDVLASKVREQLHEKKYLLVLDDLWNESDEQWERLYRPLLVGAQGSKILITTRKTQVADLVKGNIPPYKLEKLQDDECWSIIKKKAFSHGGAQNTTNMTKIGLKIAKRCSGLPLAAKFLGSLMRSRNKEVDWLSIQENDIWNTPESQSKVMPILKLSYDNLSSQLKQCFSYCSIFPKGWEINRTTLVQLWIAEGYVDSSNVGKGRSIEDIADGYFESLVWSSFLDGSQKSFLDDIKTCKMHDLVHDLAQVVAGDQVVLSLKVSEYKNTSEIRRLQLILDADISSTFLKSLKKLRTLFIPGGSSVYPDMLLWNKQLRVLHVEPSPDCTFTSSLKRLRHLRYLHLTYLDLKEVVNDLVSINKLYNLETLVFTSMQGSIENLVANIRSLKKLRHLDISHTHIEELPDSVTSLCNLQALKLNNCRLKALPESATGLRNLRSLDISFNPIEELPGFIINLGNLQTLNVTFCENLKSLPEFVKGLDNLEIFDFQYCPLLQKLPEDFGSLTQLRHLSLVKTGIKVLPESCTNLINLEFVDLSYCKLPKDVSNWRKLRRFGSSKEETPVGIGNLGWLENLTYWAREKLINGTDIDGIEELENLNTLEKLRILNLQKVKDPIDAERANLKGKRNLRVLRLVWDESSDTMWDQKSFDLQVFEALQPHTGLRKLEIHNFMGCDLPRWMCVPTGLPYLKILKLHNCKKIIQLPPVIGQLQHLTVLRLIGLMSLKSFDIGGFPSLTELYLSRMFSLEDISCSHPSLSLQFHIQENENEITPLGQEFHSGISLRKLVLRHCLVLKFLPDLRGWTSLQTLIIQNCPKVKESLTYDLESLPFLKSLHVDFTEGDKLANVLYDWEECWTG